MRAFPRIPWAHALVLPLSLLLAALPLAAQAPTEYYLVTDLGPGEAYQARGPFPGVTVGRSEAGDPCGSSPSSFGLFHDHRTRSLCPLAGDLWAEAFDLELNGYDSVVGRSQPASGPPRPVVWNEGGSGTFSATAMKLPTTATGGVGWGVDYLGQISGEVVIGAERRAAYWLIPTFGPWVFPLGGDSAAYAIGGSSTDPVTAGEHDGRFVLWYPRRSQNAVVYPLDQTPSRPFAASIGSGGVTAVGRMTTAQGDAAFLWEPDGTLTELPGLGGFDDAALGLNSSLDAVGYAADLEGRRRATLWRGGAVIDLNDHVLPTCRPGDPSLCDPWELVEAHAVTPDGIVVGTASVYGLSRAFRANPVAPLTWRIKACSAATQPLCVADTVKSGTEPVVGAVSGERTSSSSVATSSGNATPYSANASVSIAEDGIDVPSGAGGFESYILFEPGSVAALIPPGESSLAVQLHFHAEGAVGVGDPSSMASVNARIDLRPARSAGSYTSATGGMSATHDSSDASGVFASGSSPRITLPVQLKPFQKGALELRLDGSVSTSALASGQEALGQGVVSLSFCAEDPASVTLPDGTPLADVGVRYTLWPTVAGDGPCENPYVGLPGGCTPANTWDACQGGCAVCQESVAGYGCYFDRHPACSTMPSCPGSLTACSLACPPPRKLDRCIPEPECKEDTCGTCQRPAAHRDDDGDGIPDALEHDLAHRFFPMIRLQTFEDLNEAYLYQRTPVPYVVRPYQDGTWDRCDEADECLEILYGTAYFRDTGDFGHLGDSEVYAALVHRPLPLADALEAAEVWEMIEDFSAAHWKAKAPFVDVDNSRYGWYGDCTEGQVQGDYTCYEPSPRTEPRLLFAAWGKHALYHEPAECDWPDTCPLDPRYLPEYDMRSYKDNLLQNVGNGPDAPSGDPVIRHPDECSLYGVWAGEEFGGSSPYRGHLENSLAWRPP